MLGKGDRTSDHGFVASVDVASGRERLGLTDSSACEVFDQRVLEIIPRGLCLTATRPILIVDQAPIDHVLSLVDQHDFRCAFYAQVICQVRAGVPDNGEGKIVVLSEGRDVEEILSRVGEDTHKLDTLRSEGILQLDQGGNVNARDRAFSPHEHEYQCLRIVEPKIGHETAVPPDINNDNVGQGRVDLPSWMVGRRRYVRDLRTELRL